MKKILALLLATLMLLALASCGAGNTQQGADTDTTAASNNGTNSAAGEGNAQVNPVELSFWPHTEGVYATVKISADLKLEEDAWLGLCPKGYDYITEEEADEVDVIWFGLEGREDGDPYVFACDFEGVEDGTYALVVATSDNAEVGYVIIQLEMTIANGQLTFDYSNAKLNEEPAK